MKRKILFRGKRVDNDQWIEGGYAEIKPPPVCFSSDPVKPDKVCIVAEKGFADWGMPRQYAMYEVDPETVGQCTGAKDKNKKMIFEGDIVKTDNIVHDGKIQIQGEQSVVKLKKGCWVIAGIDWDFLCTNAKRITIIGNIHDNPELLSKEARSDE